MQSFRRNLPMSIPLLLVLSACGAGVNVGGPQDSPGTDGGDTDAAGSPTGPNTRTIGPQPEASSPTDATPSPAAGACTAAGGTCIPASSS
jgi:hypothetical protein